MQIIKSFQVFENSDARFGMGFEGAFHQQFAFQGRKEALRHRIIETIPDRSHGWSYPELATTIAEGNRGVLSTLVGVVDDLMRQSLCIRSVQRAQHQLRSEMILQRPTHDAPAIQHPGRSPDTESRPKS